MSRKLVELNDHQSNAVRHVWGACYVSACPGSGKTRVIVERCARLIEEGISPRSILCITFTNKAAEEMKHRLQTMIGDQAKELYISTFHALCAEILRKYGSEIGYLKNISIVKEDDQESLMAQCARTLNYDLKVQEVRKMIWAVNSAREKLFPINSVEFDDEFRAAKFGADIGREYIRKLKENNQVDFSGLLSEAIHLLETQKHVLQKLQDRFTMLQVDEAQDTNLAQFKIVQLLGEHTNVFMVGDTDQSIYNWRGARIENINDFIEKFSAVQIQLPVNYRSSKAIVAAAGKLIKSNKNRPEMDFQTTNDQGDPIVCQSFYDPDTEARWIAGEIKELVDSGEYKPSDFAVLYRNNAMSRAFEVAMMDAGVDYEVIGSFGFFDRKEIKDILSMLRFLANPKDGLALARFINKPSRRIGQTAIGKIEAFARENKVDLLQALARTKEYFKGADAIKIQGECEKIAKTFSADTKDVPLGDIMERIVTSMEYLRYLQEDDEESFLTRQQNLTELYTSASIYSNKKPNDIVGYLNKIALQSSSDKKTPDGAVTLMTIHSSKGTEFPVVFMPCADEGSLPSSMALKDRDEDAEEERRLCYVGMTRAKKKLYMSYPMTRPKRMSNGFITNIPTKPSRFFREAGLTVQRG